MVPGVQSPCQACVFSFSVLATLPPTPTGCWSLSPLYLYHFTCWCAEHCPHIIPHSLLSIQDGSDFVNVAYWVLKPLTSLDQLSLYPLLNWALPMSHTTLASFHSGCWRLCQCGLLGAEASHLCTSVIALPTVELSTARLTYYVCSFSFRILVTLPMWPTGCWSLSTQFISLSVLMRWHHILCLLLFIQDAGDFANVAYWVLKPRCPDKGKLTIEEVNEALTGISTSNALKNKEGVRKVRPVFVLIYTLLCEAM